MRVINFLFLILISVTLNAQLCSDDEATWIFHVEINRILTTVNTEKYKVVDFKCVNGEKTHDSIPSWLFYHFSSDSTLDCVFPTYRFYFSTLKYTKQNIDTCYFKKLGPIFISTNCSGYGCDDTLVVTTEGGNKIIYKHSYLIDPYSNEKSHFVEEIKLDQQERILTKYVDQMYRFI